jgi:hypothetical protein
MIKDFNPRDILISYLTESNEQKTLYLDGRDFEDEEKKNKIFNEHSEFLSLFNESSINYSVGENEYEDDDGADEDGRPIIRRWHRKALEIEKFYTPEEQIKMLEKQVQNYKRDIYNLNYVLRKRNEGYKLEANDNKVTVNGRIETFTNKEFIEVIDTVTSLKRKVYKATAYSLKPSVEYALEIIESDLASDGDIADEDDFKEYLECEYNITEEDDSEYVEEIYNYYLEFFKEIKESGTAIINYSHFYKVNSGITFYDLKSLKNYIAGNKDSYAYIIKTIDTFNDFKEKTEVSLSRRILQISSRYVGFSVFFNEGDFTIKAKI